MDYTPSFYNNRNGNKPSYQYKKNKLFFLNSSFNSDFLLLNGKIYEINFDIRPFQIYKNNSLKVISYTRDHHQSKPIQIKLKDLIFDFRGNYNTDKEGNPIIYSSHTGVECMLNNNYNSLTLLPQQITKFNLRVDDNFNKIDYNYYFSSLTNGTLENVVNSPDKYIIFKSSGSFVLDKSLTCDILIVGGGGGGGFFSGGGGAGQVLYTTNFNLPSGTYTITIGSGGAGSSVSSSNGSNGGNSSITNNNITYTAIGGGGGGTRSDNDYQGQSLPPGRAGNNGGSGGGGSHSDVTFNPQTNIGGSSTKNTYSGWISLGNSGGNGKNGNHLTGYGSGGGGGAGSIGANAGTNSGGNGGAGIDLSSIFGTNVGHSGWFGGGGGGGSYTGTSGPIGYGNGGNGLLGGGANAYSGNGINNTGGGGGGGVLTTGGSGGSGVVIIRFQNKRIEGLTPEETLITTNNSNIIINQLSQYQINYETPIKIDKGTYSANFNSNVGGITFFKSPDYTYPILKTNPKIWYKLDNNSVTTDAMGLVNLTNFNNCITNTNDYVKGDASLQFNGNNCLQSSATTQFRDPDFTISVWVKLTNITNNIKCIAANRESVLKGWALYISQSGGTFPDGSGASQLYTLNLWFGSGITGTYSVAKFLNNFFTNYLNVWTHIVVTGTKTNPSVNNNIDCKCYINGVLIASTTNNLYDNTQNVRFRLGDITDGTDIQFSLNNGSLLDDFRYYNRVITQQEVNELYYGNPNRSYPLLKDGNNETINPLVWYKFDTSATQMLLDSSGNNYNLTNNGATYDSNIFTKGNGSISFSSGNYLDIPKSFNLKTLLTTNGLSFGGWVYINSSTNAFSGIFCFGDASNYCLVIANPTLTGIRFQIQTTTININIPSFNSWVHWFWTMSTTGSWNIYINGVNVSSSVTSLVGDFLLANSQYRLGYYTATAGISSFIGLMDDFRIYSQVLTATQVSELYNGRIQIYNPPSFLLGLELDDKTLQEDNIASIYR